MVMVGAAIFSFAEKIELYERLKVAGSLVAWIRSQPCFQ